MLCMNELRLLQGRQQVGAILLGCSGAVLRASWLALMEHRARNAVEHQQVTFPAHSWLLMLKTIHSLWLPKQGDELCCFICHLILPFQTLFNAFTA